ncbi:MAG TPA: prepilin-type N-terminal cleavage/methylation domain-containing protein [Syntrophales bacterium]|nr:prepilin-type N-terminal cleavage/methylation domain-containing protein [Syntrophales bacterium]HRS86778.1 prepilin-type N-terminal cleavage/methylation domain-containing protein [Syntrophales bacterium]HRV41999.1 prepilin-type N-terminal cleavage/methylation domain-containing protein [Syntrophales bacterium]
MNERGVTLVEMIITLGVTVILMGAVYMAINAVQRHSTGIERKVTAQQDVKPALDIMALEIGMASYNPTAATGLWRSPTACTAAATNQEYKGIQEATTTTIAVEMDLNDDGVLTGANEIIRYRYDTANSYVTRETNCGGQQPFLGDDPASGRPRTVLVINNALNIPVFRYFDGQGTEIFPTAADQSMIPNIRRIDITLAVETEEVDPTTNQRRRLIYSTSALVRNHAIGQ